MMINKRLINLAPDSKKYIKRNVGLQLIGLAANTAILFRLGFMIERAVDRQLTPTNLGNSAIIFIAALLIKALCTKRAATESYMASKSIKRILREKIYSKLLKLGSSYTEKVSTAEIVQASVEGVEQLEIYFGSYLPQFFYSMLAPIFLFVVIAPISFIPALVLFLCVPLIPISIILVQKFAKKLLAKYWGQYVKLGNSFLENLQGLTTLKIYGSDDFKQEEMNKEAEHFRKITMKVLTMQLNSITIMDWVAYGGAALGIVMAVLEYREGNINLATVIGIILVSADFFLPLRLLGSFFHVAMNGMAASEKIFRLLDLEEEPEKGGVLTGTEIQIKDLSYSYDKERTVVHRVSMQFDSVGFVSIVGESGCGKSTIAGILAGENRMYEGSVQIGGTQLDKVGTASIKKNITLIGIRSYLFKGTVRDNLQMAKPEATDKEMWEVLEKVRIADFLRAENGLETEIKERGENLSGGQKQRLSVARALLFDSPIYIFDEATSNIDVESETDIIHLLQEMAKKKSIILISHRLANVVTSDKIYVMAAGSVCEEGSHSDLLTRNGTYARLWNSQMELEKYRGGVENAAFGN